MNLIKVIKNPKSFCYAALNKATNFYRAIFYKGDKVFCEICNWKGKLFFDGKCPKCNSLPRTRLVPFSLGYFDLIKPHLKILHIAPNIHEYNFIRKNFSELSIYDRLNNRDVKYINIVQDITETNLKSQIYDLAICWHVLEHVPEDLKAIKEVHRLLKPGGKFLISVPIYPVGNLKTFEDPNIDYSNYEQIHGHYDHYRSCGLDYFERFETSGFKTNTLFVNALDKNNRDYFGLREDHVVWCFLK